MQLPLTTRNVRGAWIIEDATGARIAVLAVAGPDDKDTERDARQFVRAVNAYRKMWDVCHDAYVLAEDRTDAPGPCEDSEMLSLMVNASAALDAARGTK